MQCQELAFLLCRLSGVGNGSTNRELTFAGSYASSGEFRTCIDLIASGRIDVGPLVSEVLPLSDGPSAFKRLLDGKENLLKIVLEP